MGRFDVAAPDSPRLMVEMRHRIGTLAIDVAFLLTQSWTVLFGPSGSGKSTILRAIAGLVQPDSGKIARISSTTRDRTGHDTASSLFDSDAKRCLPAFMRGIPLASQSASLFPHMSVAENVAYGRPRQSEASGSEIDAALAAFRIAPLADKGAAELSGGEAQRVNLARAALAARQDGLLLLDEPFTGLDLALRSELMLGLQSWAAERRLCVLSVTHDVAEAFQLGAEVIKIADGKVVQQGPVEEALAEERARLLRQLDSGAEQTASTEPFLSG